MNKTVIHMCVAAFALLMPAACGIGLLAASERQAVEIGKVRWERDFQQAMGRSRQSGRPLLVLFQEVPGCAGCRKFGREVLSHPVLVTSMETEFIPVLIYNNRSGRDSEILQRYGEPAWNYQVIRFLDGNGRDIIPRRDRVWTVKSVAIRMIEALEARERAVPSPLRALAE